MFFAKLSKKIKKNFLLKRKYYSEQMVEKNNEEVKKLIYFSLFQL